MSSSHDSSSLYKYSPVFSAPPIRTAHPVITITFRYFLLPLNLAFICWTAFMTIAFIRPTDPLIASLRARGFRRFNNLYIFLILTSVLLGSLNLIIIYCAFAHDKARRKHWIRNCLCNCHLPAPFPLLGALLGLSLVVAYPPIAAAALRVPLRDWAYGNACNAYALMAEVTVLDGFPRRQGEVDASSEVAVWKMGKRWYDMDLVRAFNSSLGWEKVREKEAPTDEDIRLVMSGREPVKVWPSLMRNGTFEMMLRVRDGVGYFNVSGLVQDQLRGLKTDIPGPVARVRFDLVEKR